MFALRIIEKSRENLDDPFDEVVENFELGSSYSILRKGETKEFDEEMRENYPESEDASIKGLLCTEQGKTFFIWNKTSLRDYSYFIMSDSGKTFEKL